MEWERYDSKSSEHARFVSFHSKHIHCHRTVIVLTNYWYWWRWSTSLNWEMAGNYWWQFFSLLFILYPNQNGKIFVLSTKCEVEELNGNTWYFSEIKDRKSLAQFSETSIIDSRLYHAVTLTVISSRPNTPWTPCFIEKKINTQARQ